MASDKKTNKGHIVENSRDKKVFKQGSYVIEIVRNKQKITKTLKYRGDLVFRIFVDKNAKADPQSKRDTLERNKYRFFDRLVAMEEALNAAIAATMTAKDEVTQVALKKQRISSIEEGREIDKKTGVSDRYLHWNPATMDTIWLRVCAMSDKQDTDPKMPIDVHVNPAARQEIALRVLRMMQEQDKKLGLL